MSLGRRIGIKNWCRFAAGITDIMGIKDLDRANRRYGPGEVGSLNDYAVLYPIISYWVASVPFIVPKKVCFRCTAAALGVAIDCGKIHAEHKLGRCSVNFPNGFGSSPVLIHSDRIFWWVEKGEKPLSTICRRRERCRRSLPCAINWNVLHVDV